MRLALAILWKPKKHVSLFVNPEHSQQFDAPALLPKERRPLEQPVVMTRSTEWSVRAGCCALTWNIDVTWSDRPLRRKIFKTNNWLHGCVFSSSLGHGPHCRSPFITLKSLTLDAH